MPGGISKLSPIAWSSSMSIASIPRWRGRPSASGAKRLFPNFATTRIACSRFAPRARVDHLARKLGLAADDSRRLVGAVEAALYDRLDQPQSVQLPTRDGSSTASPPCCVATFSMPASRSARRSPTALPSRPRSGFSQRVPLTWSGSSSVGYFRWSGRPGSGGTCFSARRRPGRWEAFVDRLSSASIHPLTGEQREAVRLSLSKRFLILTGDGAGVGKTTCLRAINETARHFGYHIYQLALAGRAAQRMADATGQPAQTIASWLRAAAEGRAETGAHTLIIVDEASMLDLPTTYRLLFHMHEDARLLLVGDVAQRMKSHDRETRL